MLWSRAVRRAAVLVAFFLAGAGCDRSSGDAPASPASATMPALPAPAPGPAPEPQAPEIIVDRNQIAIGKNNVATAEPALTDRVVANLQDAPRVADASVDIVAMRNARPSDVGAVVEALRRVKATAVQVKTEARDGTTQKLALSLAPRLPACATMAWIGKDAAIHVWPAGGGASRRVPRGLAGPDMTLGDEAMRKQGEACEASEFGVGADDAMTWGLVFDLAMSSLHAPWTRTSGAVLLAGAVPGRKWAAP